MPAHSRFKRDLRIKTAAGHVDISAQERNLLGTSAICPSCGKKNALDLADVFGTLGLKGEGLDFWHWQCSKCGKSVTRTAFAAAISRLQRIDVEQPDLARRLAQAFDRQGDQKKSGDQSTSRKNVKRK